jgi:P27 family predicted phage terminase small subunit
MPSGGHGRVGPLPRAGSSSMLRGKSKRAGAASHVLPMPAAPDPPPHLEDDEAVVWRHYAPLLAADGRLSPKSIDALARYCTAVVQVRYLRKQLRESAPVIVSSTVDSAGNEREIVKANPLDAMVRAWMAAARALENDLVLNPASLLRVPSQDAPDDDEFADELPS